MTPATRIKITDIAIRVVYTTFGYNIYCDADDVQTIKKLLRADGMRVTSVKLDDCTKLFAH